MFNLEQSVTEWRKQMLAAGIQSPVPLEELELHLREEIERQIQSGINELRALDLAVEQIGQTRPLKTEFKKVEIENWNRSLTRSAWILFAVSFFLPAHRYGGWGWQCAWGSAGAFFSPEFWHDVLRGGTSGEGLIGWDFHLAFLSLANLLMIASPFLPVRSSQNMRFIKCWRVFSFLALALVWLFVFRSFASVVERNNLRIGCYVWAVSFLLLFLSTLKTSNHQMKLQKGQYV